MRLGILRAYIMHIIGRDQLYSGLLAHAHKALIDQPLSRKSVILQFEEIVVLAEYLLKFQRCRLGLIVLVAQYEPRYLTRQTCRKTYKSLAVLTHQLLIYARTIVKSLGEASGYQLG